MTMVPQICFRAFVDLPTLNLVPVIFEAVVTLLSVDELEFEWESELGVGL